MITKMQLVNVALVTLVALAFVSGARTYHLCAACGQVVQGGSLEVCAAGCEI